MSQNYSKGDMAMKKHVTMMNYTATVQLWADRMVDSPRLALPYPF